MISLGCSMLYVHVNGFVALWREKILQISIKILRVKADLRASPQIKTQPQGNCSVRRVSGLPSRLKGDIRLMCRLCLDVESSCLIA